jgi:acetyl esterase/lipase
VLKYRVLPTPADFDVFISEMIAGRTGGKASFSPPDDTPAEALEDARAALALVRDRAEYWGIDPDRLGMMGFSAGAMLSVSAATRLPADERPAFIAPIYPRMTPVDVPADAPPMFVGIGSEDFFFRNGRFGLVNAWLDAGRPAEFHLYQSGAHGYGLGRPGTTTTDWLENFIRWVRFNNALQND